MLLSSIVPLCCLANKYTSEGGYRTTVMFKIIMLTSYCPHLNQGANITTEWLESLIKLAGEVKGGLDPFLQKNLIFVFYF